MNDSDLTDALRWLSAVTALSFLLLVATLWLWARRMFADLRIELYQVQRNPRPPPHVQKRGQVSGKGENVTICFKNCSESSEVDLESGKRKVVTSCVLCSEKFEAGDTCGFVLGECGHVFHQRCIQPRLEMKQPCPV